MSVSRIKRCWYLKQPKEIECDGEVFVATTMYPEVIGLMLVLGACIAVVIEKSLLAGLVAVIIISRFRVFTQIYENKKGVHNS